jgi:hypothetical protein
VSAIVVAPILVQVQEQIQTPVESEASMLVEIGVHAKLPAANDLVQTAALEAGVGYQIVDSRHTAQKVQERNGVKVVHEKPRHRPEGGFPRARKFDLCGIVELLPGDFIGLGKLLKDNIEETRIEEIIEHHMWEGFRYDVF